MVKKNILLFLSFLFIICSCTKDSPPDYPSVQITSPYSLATFSIPSTIQVTGHASDSKSLTSVYVNITNTQNSPVEQSVQIPVTSNNMNFSCSYALNDIHMVSGEYYLTVSASNGTNIESAYQQIYIYATPTLRSAIYAITRDGTGVHAWKIDSVFKASLAYTVSGDYSSSDINSYYQQLYIAGHDSGNVNVYAVPTVAFEWNIPETPSPSPYFTNVYCNNDDEFISYYLGYVKCFNHAEGLEAVYNALGGYYPVKTLLWNNEVFVEEKSISLSGGEYLSLYYAGGAAVQQTTLPGPVIAMYGYDNNDILVFGNNSSGVPYMQLYNIMNGTFYSPISLPSARLLSVAQVSTDNYLLGFSNGSIYLYAYSTNNLITYLNGVTASTLQYDYINNEVIAAVRNTVNGYSFNSGAIVASVTLPDSVRDVRILYNK